MDFREFTGKNVDEALNKAILELGVPSDRMDWKILDQGSSGFLGIGSRPARIKAKKIATIEDNAKDFLDDVFRAMELEVSVDVSKDEEGNMNIELSGDEMGTLIGKRGQTLDSLQYLVSLVVNKENGEYVRVKVDTENYRERRKETLENLAKNISYKVKKTRHSVSLEPMNPYERRIIHAALQNDPAVATRSEGEEPYRHVVVYLKNNGGQRKPRYNNHDRKDNNRGGVKKSGGKGGYYKYSQDYLDYKAEKQREKDAALGNAGTVQPVVTEE